MKKFEQLAKRPDILFVPTTHHGHEAVEALIKKTKERGEEGVIVASLNAPEPGPRFKIKHKLTYNLTVVGIVQEIDKNGRLKPSMGALIVADASGKVVGKVGTGFSRDQRIDAWENQSSWLGKAVQVSSMGFAVNALRMPVYNGDADGDIDTVSKF